MGLPEVPAVKEKQRFASKEVDSASVKVRAPSAAIPPLVTTGAPWNVSHAIERPCVQSVAGVG